MGDPTNNIVRFDSKELLTQYFDHINLHFLFSRWNGMLLSVAILWSHVFFREHHAFVLEKDKSWKTKRKL